MRRTIAASLFFFAATSAASPADYPAPREGDFIIKDFRFASGQSLSEVRIHYRTLGQPKRDDKGMVRNGVLVLHGTTGEGRNFLNASFAGELFGKGQPLDAERYYLILPDNLGHGKSTKPSDGLRARFPRYGYQDMVEAQYRLLNEGLSVNHLRLVIGTSMGGMHTWVWGQRYPDFMDALMPLASLPTQVSGRNRVWRRMISDAIRTDPDWREGEYALQPRSLRFAAGLIFFMSSNPVIRQNQAPTGKAADELLEKTVTAMAARMDANDVLYAIESSHDYDPGAGLEKIRAPLLAINFADDLINPPELGVLEKEINRLSRGQAIVIPRSEETVGHGTHTKAIIWKHHLEKFLKDTEP